MEMTRGKHRGASQEEMERSDMGGNKVYIPHNKERIKYRWIEVGKGQVRERNGKTLEGRKITERVELIRDAQHRRAQFQNKAGNTTTMGTGVMTTREDKLLSYTDWESPSIIIIIIIIIMHFI